MLANTSNTRLGSQNVSCVYPLNYILTAEVRVTGSALVVFFSKSISEIGITKYDFYEFWEQRSSHLCIAFLSQ